MANLARSSQGYSQGENCFADAAAAVRSAPLTAPCLPRVASVSYDRRSGHTTTPNPRSTQRYGRRPDDRRLSHGLYQDGHVGGVRRQRVDPGMVLLLLPRPSAETVEVAHDIEFFEGAPGIFPAADR